jgi:dTDP-4-dehydrorhamnose 3,5-epimerase
MRVLPTALPGVLIIEPVRHTDQRGHFSETWRKARYAEHGLPAEFAQDNLARSKRGVIRGLHFQSPHPQGKLVHVPWGEVFDVAVDIRRGSPTFGHWVGVVLSESNHRQLYVPEGFAHGYCVTSDDALLAYKCTVPYAPQGDRAIRWDDPDLAIRWPTMTPLLSAKDAFAPQLRNVPDNVLPRFSVVSGRIAA